MFLQSHNFAHDIRLDFDQFYSIKFVDSLLQFNLIWNADYVGERTFAVY